MTNIILTGVDPSQTALRAAEKAALLADGLGAQLHIVSAYNVNMSQAMRSVQELHSPGSGAGAYNRLIEQQGQQAQNTADAVAETLREMFPNVEVVASGVQGAPAEVLLAEAERLGAQTIVVGNKGVQGAARVLGSVARTVASETTCDLYIVNTRPR